ncbi:MAG: FAD-dependent oxidoreductase [Candidatus Shapirobacteria bacterium]|jgi:protoporphyrinogen oxidase
MAPKVYDVVILGAGLAGLACADHILSENPGHQVIILEKNKHIGGLAATLRYRGFRYDLSPHRWYTKNAQLNSWLEKLMADQLLWVNKTTPMYQFGKFFNYPVEILDVIKKIGLFKSAAMLLSFIGVKIQHLILPRPIRTMEDAYKTRFGSVLYRWFNLEYNEKLWGRGGCRSMSADFVNQRVKNLSITSAIANALGINRHQVISLVPRFRYPKLGVGQISHRLLKRLTANGGSCLLDQSITSISHTNGLYRITTTKGRFFARHLISSVPLPVLTSLLCPGHRVNAQAHRLEFIDQKIVVLFAKEAPLTAFTWLYVHPPHIKTFRFLETANWSSFMSPSGKTSLVFEYPYQPGDPVSQLTSRQLINTTINDFLRYFAPAGVSRHHLINARVHTVFQAYPKYNLTYKTYLPKIKNYLRSHHPKLQLIGRNGLFHYNNMDHSILTGILAAKNFLAGNSIYDLDQVNNDAEYVEEVRVP